MPKQVPDLDLLFRSREVSADAFVVDSRLPGPGPLGNGAASRAGSRSGLPGQLADLRRARAVEGQIAQNQIVENQIVENQIVENQIVENQIVENQDQRREPRILLDETACMRSISPLTQQRFTVRVLNISRSGLMFRGPDFIQPGVVLQIRLKQLLGLGEVRYCAPVGRQFHIGVQIQDWQRVE